LVTLGDINSTKYGDTLGKISCHRHLYEKVRGFDEAMEGYGMEDFDLVNRLVKASDTQVFIQNPVHLRFISHSNEERIKNYQFVKNLESIYVNVSGVDESEKKVLYTMKDNTWSEMAFKFNAKYQGIKALSFDGWYIERSGYKQGTVQRNGNGFKLVENGLHFHKEKNGQLQSSSENSEHGTWQEIPYDSPLYTSMILSYSDCLNRLIYQENTALNNPINPGGWGNGTVYLNFDYSKPIVI
ncbi:MAG: galactosyltransferase-related protein, partial [Chitinophagaceae bacterium]